MVVALGKKRKTFTSKEERGGARGKRSDGDS